MINVNYLVWGLWVGVTIASFLVLEITGLLKIAPWVTLSETVWSVEVFAVWLKFVLFLFFCLLAAHLATKWPS